MKTEKPEWLRTKEMHDAEIIEFAPGQFRPRSRGCMYGPTESKVDQVGDGIVDINQLMAKFQKTGRLEDLIQAGANFDGEGLYLSPEKDGITPSPYANFAERRSFDESFNIVEKAKAQFSQLNAHIRNRFENDPRKFLDFVNDPTNADELISMGLRKKPEPKPEPEVTPKDVRDEIRASQRPRKTAGKGEESGE